MLGASGCVVLLTALCSTQAILVRGQFWGWGGGTDLCPDKDATDTSVDSGSGLFVLKTSGCPNYNPRTQTAPDEPTYTNALYKFPVSPVLSATPLFVCITTDAIGTLNPSGGATAAIGIAINGIPIFSDTDSPSGGAFVYTARATFDACNGHTAPGGAYHYHTKPADGCLLNSNATVGQHSPFWGVMADGIPIAGELGDGGVVPIDLDICGGHVDATYTYYHYHCVRSSPYAVRCLRGCLPTGISGFGSVQLSASSCAAAAVQYDYSSLASDLEWLGAPSLGSSPGLELAVMAAGRLTAEQEAQLAAKAQSEYLGVMQPLLFQERPLIAGHYFRSQLGGAPAGGEVMRKRLKHIAKEISTLHQNLPLTWESAILVAVDSERADVLRALILPSPDTPYAHGLFVFDILLPQDYPQQPPLVQFLTTGGGTVLLSISALVIMPHPFFNEPGFAHMVSTPQGQARSKTYNEGIRCHTLKTAVLLAAQAAAGINPGSGLPGWATFKEAITAYYRAKRANIECTCDAWVAESASAAHKKSMESMTANIKHALACLAP
ncbi:hypothetical protein FOA52_002200 [Chlamydomonas sp. UWO 241]|nr:hypothetical protein FOA52_002200 [Chlamydomonas sp. UWO 241]